MIDHDDPESTEIDSELSDLDDVESETSTTSLRTIAILVGVGVLMVIGGLWYISWASNRVNDDLVEREIRAQAAIQDFEARQPTREATSADAPSPTGPVPQPGEVLVVNRVPGDDYGRLAIRHQDGSRTFLDRDCVRVHIAADRGVCLSQNDGVVASFTTSFFDSSAPLTTIKSYASALPSRARISPDGQLSSVTAFISGATYEDIGGEASTIVTIEDIDGEGGETLTSLTQYSVNSDGAGYDSLTAQYWGMTFADNESFYVTGFFGDTPEILAGSIGDQTLTPTGWQGSCPSLSPDGKTLVFKQTRSDGGFDLVALDLETEQQWTLNEPKSVDDQVEWLDNDTILYAVHPDGGDNAVQPEFDIWMIDIAEGSEPELFLPNADSPAVAR